MDATSTFARTYHDEFPLVDVRPVLLTVNNGQLLVAMQRDGDLARLSSGIPARDEPLDVAAARILVDSMGIEERYLEQLYSVAQGAENDWTVSVAYLCLALTGTGLVSSRFAWFEVEQLPKTTPLDRRIVEYAVLRLRAKLGYTTIAFHLLPRAFSLSELQQVYEAVLGRALDKRNFRRSIQSAGFLEATGETRREGSHRPARLFRFRAVHDADTYLTPAWATGGPAEMDGQ